MDNKFYQDPKNLNVNKDGVGSLSSKWEKPSKSQSTFWLDTGGVLCPALGVSEVPPRRGESGGARSERRTPGHKPGPSCLQPGQEGRACFSPAGGGNSEIWPLPARRSGPRARRCCRWLHAGRMSRTRPLASRD